MQPNVALPPTGPPGHRQPHAASHEAGYRRPKARRNHTVPQQPEAPLRNSKNRYRILFEQSLDAIYLVSSRGTILDVNSAWLHLFGYSPEDVPSLDAADVYAVPSGREDFLRRIAEAGYLRDTVRLKRKDGTIFDCERHVVALKDATGTVTAYQGVMHDITERMRAGESEKQQRVFAEALMETSPACILVFDSDRKVVFANPETDRVLGLSRDQVLGMTCGEDFRLLDVAGAPVPEGQLPVCRVFLTEQPLYSTEYAFDSPTGRRTLSISAAPLYDEAGSVIRVVATVEDITASKGREQALRESESRYRSLFEQSMDAVALIAVGGTLLDANQAYLNLYGHDRSAIGSLNMSSHAVDPGERADFLRRLDAAGVLIDEEVKRKRVDGTIIVCLRSAVARRDDSGRMVSYQAVIRDITERKRQELERKEGAVRLEKAMHATVEAMSATVEMRDPYTAGHQSRVTTVARAIAQELGIDGDSLQALTLASQLHDLGKLHIPAEILAKPGKLTRSESLLIKEHPQASYDLLKGVDFPWPVADIAYQHHERIDGSGYPQGLKGRDMMPEARILAVADVFEAMSSHRPYRAALGSEAALAELESHRGTLYDSAAVDALVHLVREKGFTLD